MAMTAAGALNLEDVHPKLWAVCVQAFIRSFIHSVSQSVSHSVSQHASE